MGLTPLPGNPANPWGDASPRYRPVSVTAWLEPDAGVIGPDAPDLAGLLARAALEQLTGGRSGLPDASAPYDIPIPVRCRWRADGDWPLPLWDATPFIAMADAPSGMDSVYQHKRSPSGRWTEHGRRGAFNIEANYGRYGARRIPLQRAVAPAFVATAFGDPDIIAALLGNITHLGRFRASGHGRINRWEIARVDTFNLIKMDGTLRRPMPVAASALLVDEGWRAPTDSPAPIGWTPPAWNPRTWCTGWRAGTTCRRLGQLDA